jgi:hypothetical protein
MEREAKYAAAMDSEEMRKMSVKDRAAEKERLLAELQMRWGVNVCQRFVLIIDKASSYDHWR